MVSAARNLPYVGSTQTVTYMAASGMQYSNFKVQALGANNFNSALSNGDPSPGNTGFETPYKIFQLNFDNQLLNSFTVPSNYTYVLPSGNIQSTTEINEMVIDPTGSFLYFITDYYVYKYLTNGIALNRFTEPSFTSLGGVEKLRTGFIDDRLNFFIATDKRVFKFVDIPDTLDLYNTDIETLFLPASSYNINREELVQDWVYNKSLLRIIQNHEILYKAIQFKYDINLDFAGNLQNQISGAAAFTTGLLSSTDIVDSYNINLDYFVHSNEFVTSSVVNRALAKVYELQTSILKLVSPRITQELPTSSNNSI
jgi:hypothetical protein